MVAHQLSLLEVPVRIRLASYANNHSSEQSLHHRQQIYRLDHEYRSKSTVSTSTETAAWYLDRNLWSDISQDTGLIFRSKSTLSTSTETTHRELRSKSMVSISTEIVASHLDRNSWSSYQQRLWTTVSIEIDGSVLTKPMDHGFDRNSWSAYRSRYGATYLYRNAWRSS